MCHILNQLCFECPALPSPAHLGTVFFPALCVCIIFVLCFVGVCIIIVLCIVLYLYHNCIVGICIIIVLCIVGVWNALWLIPLLHLVTFCPWAVPRWGGGGTLAWWCQAGETQAGRTLGGGKRRVPSHRWQTLDCPIMTIFHHCNALS